MIVPEPIYETGNSITQRNFRCKTEVACRVCYIRISLAYITGGRIFEFKLRLTIGRALNMANQIKYTLRV